MTWGGRTGLVLLIGVVAVSFGAILIRLTTAPSLVVAAWRMALASAVLIPWGVARWGGFTVRGLRLSLLAGVFLAFHFAFWIESLQHATVASSVVLVNTNPLFVGLLSLLLGEAPSGALWQGIVLSVCGGVLIGWGDFALGGTALWGDLLALLGAVMASGYLLVGRRMRSHGGLLPYVTAAYSTAAVLLLAATAFLPGARLPAGGNWGWIVLLALGPQLLGHTSVNLALRSLPASAVAVAILGEPVGSALWAYLVFGEGIGPLQGAGMALVLVGIARTLRAVQL
ncbi:MAG: DMT family transporter [Candidatus Bipolaricaulaceae bacterium]